MKTKLSFISVCRPSLSDPVEAARDAFVQEVMSLEDGSEFHDTQIDMDSITFESKALAKVPGEFREMTYLHYAYYRVQSSGPGPILQA